MSLVDVASCTEESFILTDGSGSSGDFSFFSGAGKGSGSWFCDGEIESDCAFSLLTGEDRLLGEGDLDLRLLGLRDRSLFSLLLSFSSLSLLSLSSSCFFRDANFSCSICLCFISSFFNSRKAEGIPAIFSCALNSRGHSSPMNSLAFFPFKNPVRLICIILESGFFTSSWLNINSITTSSSNPRISVTLFVIQGFITSKFTLLMSTFFLDILQISAA